MEKGREGRREGEGGGMGEKERPSPPPNWTWRPRLESYLLPHYARDRATGNAISGGGFMTTALHGWAHIGFCKNKRIDNSLSNKNFACKTVLMVLSGRSA